MSFFSSKRTASSTPDSSGRGSRLGPQRLAEFATRRPGRVLAVWGVVVLVSLGLTGTLLGSGLTSDSSLTNHPESAAAQDLIDARLPGQSAVDEVIVVRSEGSVVTDPAFVTHVRALIAQARQSDAVTQISSYLDPGGKILISADRHATVLPVVVAHPQIEEDRVHVLAPDPVKGRGGAVIARDEIAVRLEPHREQLAELDVVVDEEDMRRRRGAGHDAPSAG